MVAHAALAVIAALVLVGGAGTAAVATGIVHLGGTGTFDLGTLNPGQSGNVTVSTSVHLNNTGYYHLQMEKEDHIGNSFSAFDVSVSVNGTTYNLMGDNENNSGIYLAAGSHTFQIHLHYAVRDNVTSANESKLAFLFLHASGDQKEMNEANESHVNDSAAVMPADGNMSHMNDGARFALAYVTFDVRGNVANQSDDNGTDSLAVRQIA